MTPKDDHDTHGCVRRAPFPDLLAKYFEIPTSELDAKAVSDPIGSVQVDVEIIKQEVRGGSSFLVSGLVYDVDTGLVETVVAPTPLGTL